MTKKRIFYTAKLVLVFLTVSFFGPVHAQNKDKTRSEILAFSDSVCRAAGVPPGLIREIGNNETGWRFVKSFAGTSAHGDLQIIDNTYQYWYKKLKLTGGRTRENYLIIGIYYIQYLYKKYHSWEKSRYAYARGRWKDPSEWTAMEKKFMGKIDWTKYDKPKTGAKDTL